MFMWWDQCVREAETMSRTPALIFKKDRGKPLIAVVEDIPELNCFSIRSDLGDTFMDVNIFLFEDWLASKDIGELVLIS